MSWETGEHRTDKGMTPTLESIETAIDQLSLPEQLMLMERLASRIRSRTLGTHVLDENALAAMAEDPAIQQELRLIEAEFAVTEADGLDRAGCQPLSRHARRQGERESPGAN